MQLKKLKPIRDYDSYSKELTKLLAYDLYQMIYKPLIDLLSFQNIRLNAKDSVLVKAFATRVIFHKDGFVYGKFNAAISKALVGLGAGYNKTRKAFKLELAQLPPEIRSAIAMGATAESDAINAVRKKAQELTVSNIIIPGVTGLGQETLSKLQDQFKKVTPADLQIPLEMNEFQRKKMEDDYIANINLSINGLAEDAISRLRKRVEGSVGQGIRADNLKDILYAEHGITENRAKFVARQETSLFVSKFRQTRYEDAGINQYEWSTSGDERVRKDHKELNGRIFSWDNPPITDKHTGERNNPGCDYGCRCVALPVIKVAGVNVLEVS